MIYLDTSVLLLSLMDQPGAREATDLILADSSSTLVSSAVIGVETARALRRTGLPPEAGSRLLDSVTLVRIDDDVLARAADLTEDLKSLDAIHLATALMLHSPTDPVTLLTHDHRLARAARTHGLEVIDPVPSRAERLLLDAGESIAEKSSAWGRRPQASRIPARV